MGFGDGSAWIAALGRGGWLGTGPGLRTVPARGVRRLMRMAASLPQPVGRRPPAVDEEAPRARALLLLASKGYLPANQAPGGEHQGAIAENLHVEPVQRPGGPLVELHYAIGIPARVGGVDMDGVWSRVEIGRAGGAEAHVLSTEDLLLHLCIHVALHHGFDAKLVQLVDLAAVADRLGDRIDWDLLDRRAREWGVHRAAALAFALAERLLGPFTPPGKAPTLEAGEGEADPVARAERLLFQAGTRGVGSANIPLLYGPGSRSEKAMLVLRRLFPSREEMAFTSRVPPDSPRLLVLYPRRAWELWRRHGGTVRAVAGGDVAANRLLSAERERAALVEWMQGGSTPSRSDRID